MRLRIRRLGGIAGNVAFGTDLDTAELPADDASRLEAALGRVPWGGPAPAPAHPDGYRYEVAVPDEPGRGTTVLGEGDLQGDLAVLRIHLERTGAPVPRHQRGS